MPPFKNPDSRRTWGVFVQDEAGDWIADFKANDEEVTELEEAVRADGRGFVAVYLPEHIKIKPFRWAGAISEGTLRLEDLLPRYIEVLIDLVPGRVQYLASTSQEWAEYTALASVNPEGLSDCDPESVSEFAERLADELNDAAPEGYRFGSHEGDGAAIGFWREED